MFGVRHPFSRALYERDDEGHILVTETDGRWGRFTGGGRWIEGEVCSADLHLCEWVAGPLMTNFRLMES